MALIPAEVREKEIEFLDKRIAEIQAQIEAGETEVEGLLTSKERLVIIRTTLWEANQP